LFCWLQNYLLHGNSWLSGTPVGYPEQEKTAGVQIYKYSQLLLSWGSSQS